MRKKPIALVLVIALVLSLFPVTGKSFNNVIAHDYDYEGQCNPFSMTPSYFFEDFQSYSYQNGLLNIHLKLKEGHDGHRWNSQVYLNMENCQSESFRNSEIDLYVPPRVQNFSIRFSTPTHFDFWNDETDTKLDCPACSVDIPTKLSNGLDYTQFSLEGESYGEFVRTGSFPIQEVEVKNKVPVLIVPGIMGTEMEFLDETLWVDVSRTITSASDEFLNPLDLDILGRPKDLRVFPRNAISKIDYGIGIHHYTDKIIAKFIDEGYVPGVNLFVAPYDWRLGITTLEQQMKGYLDTVLAISGAPKISIIAHSYGGLLVKNVLQKADLALKNKISSVVFVGVPNLGSANAAKMLIFGDNLGVPFLSKDRLRILAQNMPAIYDLLPTKEYYIKIPGFYDDLTDPKVHHILNYEQVHELLSDMGKNSFLLEEAEEHHEAIDILDVSHEPYSVLNVVGCSRPTLMTIQKMYSGNPSPIQKLWREPKYRIVMGSGDGTVLQKSAQAVVGSEGKTIFVKGAQHSQMLGSESLAQAFLSYVQDPLMDLNIIDNAHEELSLGQSACDMKSKLLRFGSDLEFSVYNAASGAPLHRHFDFFETEIEDSKNFTFDTQAGKKYKVVLKPTIAQAQTLIIANVEGLSQTDHLYRFNLAMNQHVVVELSSAETKVTIVNSDGTTISVPDGEDDEDPDPETPSDTVSPSTNLFNYPSLVKVNEGSVFLQNSQVQFSLRASDTGSGVKFVKYSFDGGQNWLSALNDVVFTVPPFAQSIQYYSSDNAGNIEQIRTVEFRRNAEPDTEINPQPISVVVQPTISNNNQIHNPPAQIIQNPVVIDNDGIGISENATSHLVGSVLKAANNQSSFKEESQITTPIYLTVNIPYETPVSSDLVPPVLNITSNSHTVPQDSIRSESITQEVEAPKGNLWKFMALVWKYVRLSTHLIFS